MEKTQELLEKQQELLKSLEETGYKVDEDPKFKGIIKDLQHERQSRQSVEDSVAQLREENRMLTEELANQKSEEEEGESENKESNPDAFLTVAQAKQLLDDALSQGKKASEKEKKQAAQKHLLASEEEARKTFSPDKVGEGMDYDTVIKEGYNKMVKKNPAYHQVVLSSDNPAAEAYRIGLLEESFAKKLKEKETLELVGKFKSDATKGLPRGSVGALSEKEDYETLLKTSDSELERRLKEEEAK